MFVHTTLSSFIPSLAPSRPAPQALRKLIQAGAQLDARDAVGYAPIHHAADRGNLPALRELVRAGSSHAWRSNTLQTPLAAACFTGQSGAVEYLLHECEADASAVDYLGQSTLTIAALEGHLEVVKIMLRLGVRKLGPKAYPDAFIAMAMCGNVSILQELISAEGGVHINNNNSRNLVKMTPLHFSAGFCHVLPTRMLLEAGADESAVDLKGDTPLDVVDTMRSEHVEHVSGRPAGDAHADPRAGVPRPVVEVAECVGGTCTSTRGAWEERAGIGKHGGKIVYGDDDVDESANGAGCDGAHGGA